ncbi:MAG: sortase [Nitriliruptorales bacterium]|nr:sortase [Nitriliruptorales bacterium]
MPLLYRLIAVLATLALLGGCATSSDEIRTASTTSPTGTAEPPARNSETIPAAPLDLDAARGYRSVRVPRSTATPASVAIPAIGLEGPLTMTGRNDDRTLEIPEFGHMSWYGDGIVPGDPGPAAILGHVDSRSGPDVFYRLHELSPGDEIIVTSRDGSSFAFVVDRLEQHPKDAFPTEAVWLPTPEPELRLITCGGDFNHGERSYGDNIIVFATLGS